MNRVPRTLSLALGIALALGAAALPAAATAAPVTTPGPAAVHGYTPGAAAKSAGKADDRAFYEAVMKSARAKQAATPYLRAVVVTYDASNAPSFAAEIARSAQIWNGSVANVRLQEGAGADFDYYEGDDPDNGSYASTDGHGRGYIFLDYTQNQQYSSVRVTAHETGHVLGLPDHYSGPCSELMSGGGPGPSCTNAYPNSTERSRVNSLWRNGLAG
ncbi:ABC transporter substrate-binding protein [Streptomyces sp. XY431]|uniref:snapalysin n=1 Tax=Streptomyces sp. XY431 TaxID=1415562 RepID=UPI0006AFD623|nr:snapalysin [Streptomyces sp. XY431]KOV36088.1 ABC transporter substrate-binding protein [Streptomyces sp. XY431]